MYIYYIYIYMPKVLIIDLYIYYSVDIVDIYNI